MREKALSLLTIIMLIFFLCACDKTGDLELKSTTIRETSVITESIETEFVEVESESETTAKIKSINEDKKYAKPIESSSELATSEDSDEYVKSSYVNILDYIDNWRKLAKELEVPKGDNQKPVNALQEKYCQDVYGHEIWFEYETINGVKHFDIDILDSKCQVSIASIFMGDYLDKTVDSKMKELGYKRIEKDSEKYQAYKIKENERTMFVYYWKDDNGCINNINLKTDYEKALKTVRND